MKYQSLLVFTCLLLPYICSAKKKAKSVSTVINAKWHLTPVALEISEYLAEENPGLFWQYVENINNLQPPLIDSATDKERYERALGEAGKLLSPSQVNLLKLSLSLHHDSPRVEMYHQIALDRGVRCPVAVDFGDSLVCTLDNLEGTVKQYLREDPASWKRMDTFRIDHQYPDCDNSSLTLVLYGELGTPEFAQYHSVLEKFARRREINYILRHFVKERQPSKVRLSGYGVELQMKSTEYKAQDDANVQGKDEGDTQDVDEEEEVEGFNFQRLKELYPDKKADLLKLKTHLLENSNEMAPLKVWQFQDLSQQAAQRILDAAPEDQLNTFVHIAQNFPVQARSLVSVKVSPEFRSELKHNQDLFLSSLSLSASESALYLNGLYFDVDLLDISKLLETVRHELQVMQGLNSIGITEEALQRLLSLDLSPSSKTEYGLDVRDSAVQWINDIEKDSSYARWSYSLMDLLRPTFPGMLRNIKRNLYSLVIICDPSKAAAVPLLKLIESFFVHAAPLRIGIVFNVDDVTSGSSDDVTGLQHAGVAMLNAFNYIAEAKKPHDALAFLTEVYAKVKSGSDVTSEDVLNAFSKQYPGVSVDEVFGSDSDYNTGRQLSREFIARTGLTRKSPQVLMNGIPLSEDSLTAEDFEEAILTEIMRQTPKFQKAVYKGELTDSMDVAEYVMSRPNIMPRLNERVLNKDRSIYIDLTLPLSQQMLSSVHYVTGATRSKPADSSSLYLLTHWVVVDLGSEDGVRLLESTLEYLESEPGSRVAFLPNPASSGDEVKAQHYAFLAALHSGLDVRTSLNIANEAKTVAPASIEQIKNTDWSLIASLYDRHTTYVRSVLHLTPGSLGLLTNGRLIGPLLPGETFTAPDFALLDRLTLSLYTDKIYEAVKKGDSEETLTNDMLLKTISILIIRPNTRVRFDLPNFKSQYSAIKLEPANASEPIFDIRAIVDPVSRAAQKLGPILRVLHRVLNSRITVLMNCAEKNSDMPLKSFYRFVLEAEPQFLPSGAVGGGGARFLNMPSTPLLTQNLHVPDNWLVESLASPYDLDNIKLENVDSNVHSEYELEYLLLEGHCFESLNGNPPRGLQMTLGTARDPVQVDTIVMANLGYFQLKANPGLWLLRLRPGRSAEIYDITHHAGSDTPVNSTDIKVLISSFKSHILDVKVTKKPDKINMDLLADDAPENGGLWNSITSTFGGKDASSGAGGDSGSQDETRINIFSVASGHLYERFLRIMMLSVLKHTRSPVKFWFLKNYLSPTFKDFLPRMAKTYKFEYELVQYKWPRWLTQQTEKQRIIWGYKILFLDVLFPLDVKKIIFVDADQVVRADMKELVDYDLGNAPYGYVPFCDSRREMDGFRFWNQGYWRSHLQGRKYHISALYVVDLKRFRKIAAGDRLRGQYQALSQDPNSLSNLDQDLPNNMIHQVPIKSLPQEWLWCETWCSDSSKKDAKTIDLCNNPLTKEAKLSAAMRILDEWKSYDDEIKNLQLSIGEDLEAEDSTHPAHTEL